MQDEGVENYSKGANIEEPLNRNTLPIPNLPEDFVWIQVKGGTKMANVLQVAVDAMKENKTLLWTGSGAAVTKVISCAEIVKRNFKNIHQFNKLCFLKIVEEWEPKIEGLDKLAVRRDVPTMHILLSKDPINAELPGYQGPNKEGKKNNNRPRKPANGQPRQKRINPEEFSSIGLRSSNYREKRQHKNET